MVSSIVDERFGKELKNINISIVERTRSEEICNTLYFERRKKTIERQRQEGVIEMKPGCGFSSEKVHRYFKPMLVLHFRRKTIHAIPFELDDESTKQEFVLDDNITVICKVRTNDNIYDSDFNSDVDNDDEFELDNESPYTMVKIEKVVFPIQYVYKLLLSQCDCCEKNIK